MKKNNLFVNFLLIVTAIFFVSCQRKSITITDCPTCFKKCYENVRLEGEITGEVIHALSERYKNDPGKGLITVSGPVLENVDDRNTLKTLSTAVKRPEDALSMVFDIDRMKNLIWKMENVACDSGCTNQQKMGVRFYYILYPKKGENMDGLRDIPDEARGKHALVMVPVYWNSTKKEWIDFDYRNVGSVCKFSPIPYHGQRVELTPGVTGVSGDGTNHGGIGPPPEPGTYPSN